MNVLIGLLFAVASYHVTAHMPIAGDAGWDYITIDSAHHRAFVAHGDRIDVIDTKSHKLLASMPATGAHGIALAPELKRGFYTNGRAQTLTTFEYESAKPGDSWKTTGENPDAILYEPGSKRVFTFNGRGKNATVFDAATGN